ncbi:MAG: signal peptidase II [Armatimonadetes bacterium]|nr:signal peptidase II [Armatimonadota bacterium]
MRPAFWLLAGLVLVLDQFTKYLVEHNLPLNGPSAPFLPGVMVLTHVHNPGVAFGQFRNGGPLLVLTALVAAGGIVWYRWKLGKQGLPVPWLLEFGLALPLGGAVGNMLDRIRLGKVVDFFDLGWFPVFNVADSAITVGAVALLIFYLILAPADPRPAVIAPVSEEAGA